MRLQSMVSTHDWSACLTRLKPALFFLFPSSYCTRSLKLIISVQEVIKEIWYVCIHLYTLNQVHRQGEFEGVCSNHPFSLHKILYTPPNCTFEVDLTN